MKRISSLTMAALLTAAACTNQGPDANPPRDFHSATLIASLRPVPNCDDLLSYLKTNAISHPESLGYGYWGDHATESEVLVGSPAPVNAGASRQATAFDAAATAGTTDKSASPTTMATGTNNQETNVDEADLVKTNGRFIVNVTGNQLFVTELVDGTPVARSTTSLGNAWASQLFLSDSVVTVIGTPQTPIGIAEPAASSVARSSMMHYTQQTTISQFTLGEDGTLATKGSTTVDGNVLSGRLANGAIRLVLSTQTGAAIGASLYEVGPTDGLVPTSDDPVKAMTDAVNASKIEDWLPKKYAADGTATPLTGCADTYTPADFAGLSMLSVLTITDGVESMASTAVVADSQTVYASTDNLYVATTKWQWQAQPMVVDDVAVSSTDSSTSSEPSASDREYTDVHSFAINGAANAKYTASGRIGGSLLNQYSMSEYKGVLRAATTSSTSQESSVVTLRASDDELRQIGTVGGLGKGETIQSVRFDGPTGYVVTFRQTDPFYVIDLSDPAAPKTVGELKLPGFSSYLHPISDNLVLGIGTNADESGRMNGAKVSVFDVSDPTAPKELHNWTAKDLQFQASSDAKAFAYDADTHRAYLPFYASCFDACGSQTANGVLVLDVSRDAMTEAGRIFHDAGVVPMPEPMPEPMPMPTPEPVPTTEAPPVSSPSTTVPSPKTTTTTPTVTTTEAPTTTTSTTTTTAPAVQASPATTEVVAQQSTEPSAGSGEAVDPSGVTTEPVAPDSSASSTSSKMAADYAPYMVQPTISRVFVVNGVIVTLSDAGIATNDVKTLQRIGFRSFA